MVRLVEEVKDKAGVTMTNEDVFMATSFGDFKAALVGFSRGSGGKAEFVLKDPVNMHVNKMDISFAKQVNLKTAYYSTGILRN